MDTRAVNANWNGGLSAVSWEASIQKSFEEELYSSVEVFYEMTTYVVIDT